MNDALTVQREAVRQHLGVPPPQALNPYVRRAERGRGRLHAQAGGLAEEHRDAARRHQRLLLDLLAVDDLDAKRLVFQPRARTRRHHNDGFAEREPRELHLDTRFAAG